MTRRFTVMGWCGLLLLLTPLFFKWSVLDKLAAARAGVDSIPYDDRFAVILCLGFFGGLGSFIGAWKTPASEDHLLRRENFFNLPDEYKSFAGIGVVTGFLVGFGLRSWFLARMLELGYEQTSAW